MVAGELLLEPGNLDPGCAPPVPAFQHPIECVPLQIIIMGPRRELFTLGFGST
jgi:hypothetical protein